jgi:hypothetical protein
MNEFTVEVGDIRIISYDECVAYIDHPNGAIHDLRKEDLEDLLTALIKAVGEA